MAALLESWRQSGTTVLVFEDLHWADDGAPRLPRAPGRAGRRACRSFSSAPHGRSCTSGSPTFGAQARNAQRINLVAAHRRGDGPPRRRPARAGGAAGGDAADAARASRREPAVRGGVRASARGPEVSWHEDVDVPDSVQALIAARLDTLLGRAEEPAPGRRGHGQGVLGGRARLRWATAIRARSSRPCTSWRARSSCARPVPRARWKAKPSTASGMCSYGRLLRADPACRPRRPSPGGRRLDRGEGGRAGRRPGRRARPPLPVRARAQPGCRDPRSTKSSCRRRRCATSPWPVSGRSHSTSTRPSGISPSPSSSLPPGHPARASLLERWAQAAQQQGRLQDARQAFEEAADLYRAAGRARGSRPHPDPPRPRASTGSAIHESEEVLAEALELLEAQPAGPELVSAYAYMAGRGSRSPASTARAVAAADRALALAAELGLPEPAFALSLARHRPLPTGRSGRARGRAPGAPARARAGPGTRDRRHLREPRRCRSGCTRVHRRASTVNREAIAFCERRGITELALQDRCQRPDSAGGARTDRAGTRRGRADRRPDPDGRRHVLALSARAAAAPARRNAAGRTRPRPRAAARRGPRDRPTEISSRRRSPPPPSSCSPRVDASRRTRCCASSTSSAPAQPTSCSGAAFPGCRTALALDDQPLAQRLAPRHRSPVRRSTSTRSPRPRPSSPRPPATAPRRELYARPPSAGASSGTFPSSRTPCSARDGVSPRSASPRPEEPLREAKELFASMGYKPALAETEALLAETAAAAS